MKLREKIELLPYALKGYLFSSAHKNGEYKYLRKVIKDRVIIFDVGANVGEYAAKAMEIAKRDNIEIHCFEPVSDTFTKLEGLKATLPNIKLVLNNFGFSNEEESLEINIYGAKSEINSIYRVDQVRKKAQFQKKEKIRLQKVDNYIKESGLTKVDFLKIDVEGHEWKVILGSLNSIKSGKIKVIQFECNKFWKVAGHSIIEVGDFLIENKYRLYRLTPWGKIRIRDPRRIGHPFPQGANYVAELQKY